MFAERIGRQFQLSADMAYGVPLASPRHRRLVIRPAEGMLLFHKLRESWQTARMLSRQTESFLLPIDRADRATEDRGDGRSLNAVLRQEEEDVVVGFVPEAPAHRINLSELRPS